MRKKLLIVGGILIVMLVGLMIFSKVTKVTDQDVADKFTAYVLADKSSESYELFSTTAKNSQSLSEWKTVVDQLSQFLSGSKILYTNKTLSTVSTNFGYGITGPVGNYKFSVVAVQDGGTWKIASFLSQQAPAASAASSTDGSDSTQ